MELKYEHICKIGKRSLVGDHAGEPDLLRVPIDAETK
jgi:hypothetical protein